MKIKPQDVGNFRSPAHAQAHENALATRERYDNLVQDLVSLDNGRLDKNAQAGKLVLLHANASAELGDGQKSQDRPASGLEEANVNLEFDPSSGEVSKLSFHSHPYDVEARQERGFLRVGQKRLVVDENNWTGETHTCYFADGTITRR